MKIVTSSNILLDQNIIAIYTDLEKFIEAVENSEQDGFLRLAQKDIIELKGLLHRFSNADNECTFFGLFYSVDPFDVDIDVQWTILRNNEEYETVLRAIANDDLFMMVGEGNNLFKDEADTISRVGQAFIDEIDFAEDEPDEYDENDLTLELDVFDNYLDDINDEETDLY